MLLSRTSICEASFQLFGLRVTLLESLVILQGPCSYRESDSWTAKVEGTSYLEKTDHAGASGLCRCAYVRCYHPRYEAALTPPFSQILSGAVDALLRASKNQNHMLWLAFKSA